LSSIFLSFFSLLSFLSVLSFLLFLENIFCKKKKKTLSCPFLLYGIMISTNRQEPPFRLTDWSISHTNGRPLILSRTLDPKFRIYVNRQ
jgi:hypothetical protein